MTADTRTGYLLVPGSSHAAVRGCTCPPQCPVALDIEMVEGVGEVPRAAYSHVEPACQLHGLAAVREATR